MEKQSVQEKIQATFEKLCQRCGKPIRKPDRGTKYCGNSKTKGSCVYEQHLTSSRLHKWRNKAKLIIQDKARYFAHRELRIKQRRLWDKRNPEKRRNQKRIASYRLKGAPGSHTAEEWKQLQEIYDSRCVNCHQLITLTRDHKIPITRGGANSIDNITPLCRSCNSKKSTNIWLPICKLNNKELSLLTIAVPSQ
jgi:5-methylcytosine-specific restriction endonuclease McrA